ncbi:methyltransferase [Bacillus sp. FJAT-27225]|uniref:class I SAM-dependent methyltransferase n=1 Tax=Bacillus sp. FJAT-27225 TaxID=1743144 RepID=UPI00080C20C5|nr:class I SAM-dependent methyltransferase [Bacillus sp. FJAT-27225]OCA81574.1 methyltransferase [Bacillus sp. FJAT-27225]
MREMIHDFDDLLLMLDELLKEQSRFDWNSFYTNREKKVPFFANNPDENLVNYFDDQLFKPGRVLELGCGPGRNAIYFAEKGCTVDAVDLSKEALEWAKERAEEKNLEINFIMENIFDLHAEEGSYDIIYDSGCFHHIPPHRRMSYINLINKALKADGLFAITCFVENGKLGGANISDWEVYRIRSLKGGLGFSKEKLRSIFKDFKEIEIRSMRELHPKSNVFGVDGLLTAVFKKSQS